MLHLNCYYLPGGVSYIGRDEFTPNIEHADPSKAKKPHEIQNKKKKKFALPWWSIYVAYFLSFASVGTAFYMTVEVAGVFGPKKSREWLFSFCISIFESIFFSQPLKVTII